MLSKIQVWDPGTKIRDLGSRKNLSRIRIPGSNKREIPDAGSGSATLLSREEKKILDEKSVPTTRRHWAGRKMWLVRAGESITSFTEYLDVFKMYKKCKLSINMDTLITRCCENKK
jgi:hypothetical protein